MYFCIIDVHLYNDIHVRHVVHSSIINTSIEP